MLKDMIADNSLRRPKELLKLPELRIIDEYVEMESKQEKLYKEVNGVCLSDENLRLMSLQLNNIFSFSNSMTTERFNTTSVYIVES